MYILLTYSSCIIYLSPLRPVKKSISTSTTMIESLGSFFDCFSFLFKKYISINTNKDYIIIMAYAKIKINMFGIPVVRKFFDRLILFIPPSS